MKINPSGRVFLIVGLTFVMLLGLYFLPEIHIGDMTLRRVDVLADLADNGTTDTISTIVVPQKPVEQFKETWPKGVEPIIDYGDTLAGGMAHFYDAVVNAQQMNRPVRIAYYSDSFVEGDIMLSDLRQQLQKKFGGSGVGWVDMMPPFGIQRLTVTQSSKGLTGHLVVDKKGFSRFRQGISQSYYIPTSNASATFSQGFMKRYRSGWGHATVYVRTGSDMVVSTPYGAMKLQASPHVQAAAFQGKMTSVRFSFAGGGASTDIYGVALESSKGIILDNLALRSTPGVTLADLPEKMLADFAQLRPYDLIVVHYGLNAVADCDKDDYCKRYMGHIKKSIEHLRAAYPDASILIASASDIEDRNGSEMMTTDAVQNLVAHQQQLAAECHVGFISIFNLMGGKGSMKQFVTKGWGEKDFTHINQKGGAVIGERFFKSFDAAINNYKRKKAAGY